MSDRPAQARKLYLLLIELPDIEDRERALWWNRPTSVGITDGVTTETWGPSLEESSTYELKLAELKARNEAIRSEVQSLALQLAGDAHRLAIDLAAVFALDDLGAAAAAAGKLVGAIAADEAATTREAREAYPARWYSENSEVTAENLRSAVRDKKLATVPGNGKHPFYPLQDVKRLWPDKFPPPPNPQSVGKREHP